jgi:hypothetical protein
LIDALGETFAGLQVEWTDERFRDVGCEGLPAGILIAASTAIATIFLALGDGKPGLLLADVSGKRCRRCLLRENGSLLQRCHLRGGD